MSEREELTLDHFDIWCDKTSYLLSTVSNMKDGCAFCGIRPVEFKKFIHDIVDKACKEKVEEALQKDGKFYQAVKEHLSERVAYEYILKVLYPPVEAAREQGE